MSRKPVQRSLTGSAILADEAWLRQRLTDHGALECVPDLKRQVLDVTAGATTTAVRAERMRELILRHGLGAVIAGGTRQRKPETYTELFERVYGEPLITAAMREATAKLRRRKA